MCLNTSQFKSYTPTSEITAYKLVKKATNKENIYYSPFQGAVYDFNSKTSHIQLSTGKNDTSIIKQLETAYERENNNNICYEAITKLQNG